MWGLFKDKDKIIRVSAFDIAELLGEKDRQMLMDVCNYISEKERSPILRKRAAHVKEELLTNARP